MLRNVVGIVSGGASGLGAAAAAHIVKNGGKVVVADLPSSKDKFFHMASSNASIDDPSKIWTNETTNELHCPVLAFSETDVTNSDQISSALDVAEKVFGRTVNAAISCAGIGVAKKTLSKKKPSSSDEDGTKFPTFQAHPEDLFIKTLNVNVVGTFNLARLAAERMASSDIDDDNPDSLRGCIINTASIAAFEGQIGQVAYSSSKGAIVGMTLPMARDLAPLGIRVMTIVSTVALKIETISLL
jgi:3-hydroxyacyl-CoA dehydrogenase/3-hydroxy-2-methylbutyryl-CoA dehydrogenase